MSRKERNRLTILVGIKGRELTLVQAADLLDLGYRQTKRVWQRYQAQGDGGLAPRLRGRPSARRKPAALRAQVLARYAEDRYADFGPTLRAEPLALGRASGGSRDLAAVGAGDGPLVGAAAPSAQPMAGAQTLLWGDGANGRPRHDWFEGRREPCVLMVRVDDAIIGLRINNALLNAKRETTRIAGCRPAEVAGTWPGGRFRRSARPSTWPWCPAARWPSDSSVDSPPLIGVPLGCVRRERHQMQPARVAQ